MSVPALADEEPPISPEEGTKDIYWAGTLDDIGEGLFVKKELTLWNSAEYNFVLDGYTSTTKDEVFTVKNLMTVDDGSYILISGYGYENRDGMYIFEGAGDDMYYVEGRGLIRWEEMMEDTMEIKAGQSVTFKLPIDQYASDTIFRVSVAAYLAKYDYTFETYAYFKVDEAAVAAAKAAASKPGSGRFTDVRADSPYLEAINWAVDQKIANGKTPTTFEPSSHCSIRHILTFLWRANGRPGDNGNERAAVTAWANKVGLKDPESNVCTRSTAVFYMWKAAGSPEPKKAASFTDVSPTASYAKAVSWAVEKGITTGLTATTFAPERTCTRGQIVTFLYRSMK